MVSSRKKNIHVMKGGVTRTQSPILNSLLLAFKLPSLLMKCIGHDCMESGVNVNEARGASTNPVATMQGNVTKDPQLRFRLLKVVTQHFVQHKVPITDEIKNIIVEIVMIVLPLKSKNTSNSSIQTELQTMMERIHFVPTEHNMATNVESFKAYVNKEIDILNTELSMLQSMRSTPTLGRNNSWISSTSSWPSEGDGQINTSAIDDKIAVIESMIAAFNDKSVDVYVSLVKAAKAIVSNCMYTFVENPGGSIATKSDELKEEFKIGLVSETVDITQHIINVLAKTKKNLGNDEVAANLLNGIITAEITYTSLEARAVANVPAQAIAREQARAANAQARDAAKARAVANAQARDAAEKQVTRMENANLHSLANVPGVKASYNPLYMMTNIENPVYEADITMTAPSVVEDSFKVIYQVAQSAQEAGKSTKVKVLGRTRKVIKEGRRKFVMVKGVKMALVDARKAEKEIARAKKN